MRTDGFRRSCNVEDYRDQAKPVDNRPWWFVAIAEVLALCGSRLARDAGRDDVKRGRSDG